MMALRQMLRTGCADGGRLVRLKWGKLKPLSISNELDTQRAVTQTTNSTNKHSFMSDSKSKQTYSELCRWHLM